MRYLFILLLILTACGESSADRMTREGVESLQARLKADSLAYEEMAERNHKLIVWEDNMRTILRKTGYSARETERQIDSMELGIHGKEEWLIKHQQLKDSIAKANHWYK